MQVESDFAVGTVEIESEVHPAFRPDDGLDDGGGGALSEDRTVAIQRGPGEADEQDPPPHLANGRRDYPVELPAPFPDAGNGAVRPGSRSEVGGFRCAATVGPSTGLPRA